MELLIDRCTSGKQDKMFIEVNINRNYITMAHAPQSLAVSPS